MEKLHQYEVVAMVKQLGIPTWFMTLSCAEDGMKHFKSLQKQEILQLLMKSLIIYTLHKNAQIFAQIQGQLQAAGFSPYGGAKL